MKITVDLFVHKESQLAAAFVRKVGDQPSNINRGWVGYDCYTFSVDVNHITEYPELKAKEGE